MTSSSQTAASSGAGASRTDFSSRSRSRTLRRGASGWRGRRRSRRRARRVPCRTRRERSTSPPAAAKVLEFHHTLGVNYFKIDGVEIKSTLAERNLRRFVDAVLDATGGRVVFDLDATAGTRPDYFGLVHAGPVFVENRYTDFHRYWPHQTLRNFWKLAHYIDPVRLRMEFLNSARNQHLYAGDPLAPARYSPAYLFATVMFSSPLGWFEVSHLPAAFVEEVGALVKVWKAHREAVFRGRIIPLGAPPDGTAWTGFVSVARGGVGKNGVRPRRKDIKDFAVRGSDPISRGPAAYVLVFRELNDQPHWSVDLPMCPQDQYACTALAGDGSATMRAARLTVELPRPQSFLFARIAEPGG